MNIRRIALYAAAGYFIALHAGALVVAAMVLIPGMKPGERTVQPREAWFHDETAAYQLRGDPLLPGGLIIFMGDSLVQGLPMRAIGRNAVNYGIGGETSAGLLDRIPRYGSLPRAQAIVIHIGANDVRHDADAAILARYAQILKALPAEPTVMCSALLPVDHHARRYWVGRSVNRVEALNQRIEALCAAHEAGFVSAWTALADDAGSLQADYHIGDGLHLSPAGNRVWVNVLRQALRAAQLRL